MGRNKIEIDEEQVKAMAAAQLTDAEIVPKVGRPKIELNWDAFNALCYKYCTLEEIAAYFECSEDTIERAVKSEHGMRFREYLAIKGCRTKISLRTKQLEMAQAGNVAMLIWLGKQLLGQKNQHEVSGPNGGPVRHEAVDFDIKKLSEEDVYQLRRLVESATVSSSEPEGD